MARIAPDLPELEQVPYSARSIVYVRAMNDAIRSPLTWLIGAIVVAAGVGIGGNQGSALFGRFGGFLGITLGAAGAVWCFFKLVVPWRARRLLPAAIAQTDRAMLDNVRDADDRVTRSRT